MRHSSETSFFSAWGWAAILTAAALAWLACLAPTGLRARELAIFAAPGALLWMGVGCAAHSVALGGPLARARRHAAATAFRSARRRGRARSTPSGARGVHIDGVGHAAG